MRDVVIMRAEGEERCVSLRFHVNREQSQMRNFTGLLHVTDVLHSQKLQNSLKCSGDKPGVDQGEQPTLLDPACPLRI